MKCSNFLVNLKQNYLFMVSAKYARLIIRKVNNAQSLNYVVTQQYWV